MSRDFDNTADGLRRRALRAPIAHFAMPAWLLSVLLHVGLLFVFGLAIRFSPGGAAAEPVRTVGVVLKHTTDDRTEYFERASDRATEQPAPSAETASQQATDFLEVAAPVDPTQMLPQPSDRLAPGGAESIPTAGEHAGAAGPPLAGLNQGQARTSVFGLTGEGFKFVYVFDRSGSMGGNARSALNAAKNELLASLESLDETHQFQIIFYNHQPLVFTLAGPPGRLVFANERNKSLANRFVRSVTADGGTEHDEPLRMALGMRPDVLYFLTDADEPELSAHQLSSLARSNGGRTKIHCIEFGFGPASGRANFLMRLAEQNGGDYRYIDVSTFGRGN